MTDTQLWSWIVMGVGVIGFYFAGKKLWWSWYIGLGGQILWTVYALVSEQPAFLVSVVIYSIFYAINAYTWTKEHLAEKARRADFAELFKKPGFLIPNDGPIVQSFGNYMPHVSDFKDGDTVVIKQLNGSTYTATVDNRQPFFTFAERQDSEDFIPTEDKLQQDMDTRYGILRDGLKTAYLKRVFDDRMRDIIRAEYGFH